MGAAEEIYKNPREDYTRRLIDAVPRIDIEAIRTRRRAREAAAVKRG